MLVSKKQKAVVNMAKFLKGQSFKSTGEKRKCFIKKLNQHILLELWFDIIV